MKQNLTYTAKIVVYSLLLLIIGPQLLSCKEGSQDTEVKINGDVAVPQLLPRTKDSGPKEEAELIRKTYDAAVAALKKNSADGKAYLSIATAFISEGRITGNNGYYSEAAIKMLDKARAVSPENKDIDFESLSLKSAVLLNMHQFKDALATAKQGVTINSYNAGIYGAMIDAHVEMGDYNAAVADCDKMLNIRPDLRSYSRASYLRQIHGDNDGALEAMKMAVESGVPGMESTEWARVNWGDLYFNIGKLDTARMIYESVLSYRPGYPYAEMGLARVAAAHKNYDQAITHTSNAIKVLSEAAFVSYLGDLYTLKGDKEKGEETHKDVVRLLEEGEKDQAKSKILQHNGHRELAMAYLSVKDYDKALLHAQADYNLRPANIDANELMAWVLYLKGAYAEAVKYQDVVFKTKIKNANLSYKAGLVYAAAGNATRADQLKKEGLSISSFIDPRITELP